MDSKSLGKVPKTLTKDKTPAQGFEKSPTNTASYQLSKSTFAEALSEKPKQRNPDPIDNLSKDLKEKYKNTDFIDLTFEPLHNIVYNMNAKDQLKPNLFRPKQTTFDDIWQKNSKPLKPIIPREDPFKVKEEPIKPRQLPESFSKKLTKKEKEDEALSVLKKWKKETLKEDLPVKRKQEELNQVIKKQAKKSVQEQNKELLNTYNHATFSVDDFIKKQEKEKIEARKREQEKISAEELNLKQKQYRETMGNVKESAFQSTLTEDQIQEREKLLRASQKDSTAEFFNHILSINLYRTESPALEKIPTTFKHGGEYINYFMPAFFEEVKAEILSAVSQNNMSNFWTVSLGINRSVNGIDYLDYEEVSSSRRFSGNLHTEDLLMLIKEEDSKDQPSFHSNFSKWSKKPTYVLSFVEKIKTNNQIVFRVLPGVVDYLFEGKDLNTRVRAKVFIIDSCTTLIREFKMIRLSEFLELSRYLYEPSKLPLYDRAPGLDRLSSTLEMFYNQSQVEAILTGFKLTQGIFLLQGPPGTGKTHTIRGLLSVLFKKNHRKNRILVCAPSNSAIDEIANRVATDKLFDFDGSRIEDIKLVRIVSQNHHLFDIRESKKPDTKEMPDSVKKISLGVQVSELLNESESVIELENLKKTKDDLDKVDDLIQHYLKNQEDPSKIRELQERKFQLTQISYKQKTSNKKALDKLKELEQSIINNSHIVFTTLSGAASKELDNPTCEFDYIIIDEACQSVELSSLIPFRYKSRVVILVGDPRQLPSTTFSQQSSKNNYSRSLFERLMQGGCQVKMLETQYRMVREISEFPSSYFYENRLKTHEKNDLNPVPAWISSPGVLMINLQTSRESKKSSDTSLSNTPECEFIGKLFTFLKPVHGTRLNIGIITPYKKQVRIIKEYFQKFYPETWKNDVEINTIDGFQGREKDVIVFSAVRSAESLGFLADVRRVNVAITRAKFALWVVASRTCLERNQCWSSFIDYCYSKGRLLDCRDFNEVSNNFEPRALKKPETSSRPLLETPPSSFQLPWPNMQELKTDKFKNPLISGPQQGEALLKAESSAAIQPVQPSWQKPSSNTAKTSQNNHSSSSSSNPLTKPKQPNLEPQAAKKVSADSSSLYLNILSRK